MQNENQNKINELLKELEDYSKRENTINELVSLNKQEPEKVVVALFELFCLKEWRIRKVILEIFEKISPFAKLVLPIVIEKMEDEFYELRKGCYNFLYNDCET